MNKFKISFVVFIGSMALTMGIWGIAGLITGLNASGWSITTMALSYMSALGMTNEYSTLVDFYTHIKGVEYLIAGAFFIAFPLYFKYMNKVDIGGYKKVKS